MNPLVLFLAGVVLTLLTGLFVVSEFTLVNLDRSDLEAKRARGVPGLNSIIVALRHTSTHLSSAQLGITLTTLLAGYTFEPAFSVWLDPLFLWMRLPESLSGAAAGVVSLLVATVLSMLFGELVPKNFAIARPLAAARLSAPFQMTFTAIFKPAVLLLDEASKLVLRMFRITPQEELSSARSAEELASLVRNAALAGSLDSRTATLLARTLDFGELAAGDVMTARTSVAAVAGMDAASAVIRLARDTGHSRFPVFGEDLDDVTGVVHLKDAVRLLHQRRADTRVSEIMRPMLRVPDSMPVPVLLGQLRAEGVQLAVVVDEYGGTAGVVTLEDVVEELVGEVSDEHDRLRSGVVRLRSGEWMVPGRLRPDELAERTGIEIPEDPAYETLGGFLMSRLGEIPSAGDVVHTPDGGSFTVVRMDRRRVDRVRCHPGTPAQGADDE
ncbi:MAG: hemolysin family protein [Microbacteriaceae bacterium]|jgi:CBS domain containing-hemolysin-like protein|nr:hemolysin family protein [Microbacteriaceae bacterium]MCI1207703.1 hemolysin family protein [Microbacteriaceae bacterium]